MQSQVVRVWSYLMRPMTASRNSTLVCRPTDFRPRDAATATDNDDLMERFLVAVYVLRMQSWKANLRTAFMWQLLAFDLLVTQLSFIARLLSRLWRTQPLSSSSHMPLEVPQPIVAAGRCEYVTLLLCHCHSVGPPAPHRRKLCTSVYRCQREAINGNKSGVSRLEQPISHFLHSGGMLTCCQSNN